MAKRPSTRPPTRKRRQAKPRNTAATVVKPVEASPKEAMVDSVLAKYKLAKTLRELWEPNWQECYDFALPNRRGFNDQLEGQRRSENILDSTAVHAVPEFGSRMKSGTCPAGSRWINLKPGRDFDNPVTPKEKKEVADVEVAMEGIEKDLFESLLDSNFDSEADEAFVELAIGTGILRVDDGGLEAPFKFRSIPLTDIYCNVGPFGTLDEFFEPVTVRGMYVKARWPKIKLSKDLQNEINESPLKPITFLECVLRDRTTDKEEIYNSYLIHEKSKEMCLEEIFKGEGSNPYIAFRWSKSSGEVWGRGPLLWALGDIKTLNLTIELVLENAEKAIAGIWQSDDETINPDTINFVPGTIIPKMPGTTGLEPLEAPGRMDMAQMILDDMRKNVKKGLFSEPLGGTEGTPMSATEAAQRLTDLSRIIGSPFGRLVNEMVRPTVRRCLYIRRKAGKIKIPRLGSASVRMIPVSPLARAADQERILQIDRFLEMIMMRFGPQMMNMVVKGEEAATTLAELFGVPSDIVRNSVELKAIADRIQGLQDSPGGPDVLSKMMGGGGQG